MLVSEKEQKQKRKKKKKKRKEDPDDPSLQPRLRSAARILCFLQG
jgi:hypothetical protein